MLSKGDGTDKDLDKSKEYLEASKTKSLSDNQERLFVTCDGHVIYLKGESPE